jgi:hypothetical protein
MRVLYQLLQENEYSDISESKYRSDKQKQTQWPESMSELYRLSDSRLLKLVPIVADRGVSCALMM